MLLVEVRATGIGNLKTNRKRNWFARLAGVNSADFVEVLANSSLEKQEQLCGELLKEIDSQVSLLKKGITPQRLQRYRELVLQFMKTALPNAYSLHEERSWDRTGHQRNFLIVKKVNEHLESLMQDVAGKQMPLKVMARVDQIRGLLLDLSW